MLLGGWRFEMMALKLGIVSVLCLVVGAFTRENMDCYSTDSHPYLMFGLKTAYDLIYERPRQRNNEIPGKFCFLSWWRFFKKLFDWKIVSRFSCGCWRVMVQGIREEVLSGQCSSWKIWEQLSRRITKNGEVRFHVKVDKVCEVLGFSDGRLCYGDLDRLRGWTLNVSMTDAKMLTAQGRSDMYFLAKRFRTRYPSLFTQGYSQNRFVVSVAYVK